MPPQTPETQTPEPTQTPQHGCFYIQDGEGAGVMLPGPPEDYIFQIYRIPDYSPPRLDGKVMRCELWIQTLEGQREVESLRFESKDHAWAALHEAMARYKSPRTPAPNPAPNPALQDDPIPFRLTDRHGRTWATNNIEALCFLVGEPFISTEPAPQAEIQVCHEQDGAVIRTLYFETREAAEAELKQAFAHYNRCFPYTREDKAA